MRVISECDISLDWNLLNQISWNLNSERGLYSKRHFFILKPQIQPQKCNKKQFRSVPEVGQDDLYRLEMNSI